LVTFSRSRPEIRRTDGWAWRKGSGESPSAESRFPASFVVTETETRFKQLVELESIELATTLQSRLRSQSESDSVGW
jgi:hypothetical protein